MNVLQRIPSIFVKYHRKLCQANVRKWATSLSSSGDNRIGLKLLFFGSDNFSVASLVGLAEASKTPSAIAQVNVVTRGDYNPVAKYAKTHQLLTFKWPITSDVVKELNYDAGVVVSFGHMIPEDLINAFPLGMINVHASLLPRWRGASPIIHSVLNDDRVTGVSIMKIAPKRFDIGDILAQREVQVPENVMMPELYAVMASEGAALLVHCLLNLPEYLRNAKPQSDENVSYAPKITNSMAEINWTTMDGKYIFNLYRALYTVMYLTTTWQQIKAKIIEIQSCDSSSEETSKDVQRPGTIVYRKKENSLHVQCRDGSVLKILKLQLEGRRVLLAADFNNGYLKKVSVDERYFE